jgi:hypothetical protein
MGRNIFVHETLLTRIRALQVKILPHINELKNRKQDYAVYNFYMKPNVPSLNLALVYLEEARILRRLG